MKIRNKVYLILLMVAAFSLSACSKFLDELPDNRTELDSEEKILAMLVTAYPGTLHVRTTEYYSDNVDELAYLPNPAFDAFIEQIYNWQDVNQGDNEDPSYVWAGCYSAIASANQALDGIEKMGGPTTPKLKAAMGEALIARAYAHFLLVNIFCQTYHPEYSKTDLGLPYMEKAETTLNPKYERGTVADVYAKIATDVEAGLPLIDETVYTVPKYHFNKKAAYAFAARFYLFYQKWEEAVQTATEVLGSSPKSMLRDYASLSSLPQENATGDPLHAIEFINASSKCNLLLLTGVSRLSMDFGWYRSNIRYSHGDYISAKETYGASPTPWSSSRANWYETPYILRNQNFDKTFAMRYPLMFEYLDPIAQTGYFRTVLPALTTDETLLVRAEAYIMQKQYGAALSDMNVWISNTVRSGSTPLTEASVNAWAQKIAYYTPSEPTIKKAFDAPAFEVVSGTQENMCHALLYMRRIETMHQGLRLFDVKRYGITMHRRKLSAVNTTGTITSVMRPRDSRCAIQLPDDVLAAGMTPNPR